MRSTVVAALLLATTACSESRPPLRMPPADLAGGVVGLIVVVAEDVRFRPTELRAEAGQRLDVELDNRDEGVLHNIRFDGPDGAIKVPLESGPNTQRLTVQIDEPGSYNYLCEIHPQAMRGVLTVTPG